LVVIGRAGAFTAEQWLRADGDPRKAAEAGPLAAGAGARCDRIGCVVAMGEGRMAALVEDRRGFAEDCRRATIVVSRLAAPPGCAAALVIDRGLLGERGALAIRFGPSGPVIEGARRAHETRPWLARGDPARTVATGHPSAPAAAPPRLPPERDDPARDLADELPDEPDPQ
jgi:competence protein ComEC